MSDEDTAVAALLGMNHDEVGGRSIVGPARVAFKKRKHFKVSSEPHAIQTTEIPTSVSTAPGSQDAELDQLKSKQKRRKRTKVHYIEPSFPVPPRVVQVCKMPKTHVDHSYKDCSSVPPEADYTFPTKINDLNFAEKLHDILSRKKYGDALVWMPHGRAFRIMVPRVLEKDNILQDYFGHNRYSTFLSQLKNHGFKQLTQGRDRTAYYHEFMLRGLPHLCKYMPTYKEGRKLLPDPSNEPDFYTISMLWPLPDSALPAPTTVQSTVASPANSQLIFNAATQIAAAAAPPPAPASNKLDLHQLLGLVNANQTVPAVPESVIAYLSRNNPSQLAGLLPQQQQQQQPSNTSLLQSALNQPSNNCIRQQAQPPVGSFMSTSAVSGVGLTDSLVAALLEQSGLSSGLPKF